jgi:hypothetical protein
MLKLYRFSDTQNEYWETWEDDSGNHLVHWGVLGTRGNTRTVQSNISQQDTSIIQEEINDLVSGGFAPIDPENHAILMIEHAVEGMGNSSDLDKRHRLEDRMNETLGWTGLGACDGGSIGSGSMEVCNFVVDFETAKRVIEQDLAGTEFADYTRIYVEDVG